MSGLSGFVPPIGTIGRYNGFRESRVVYTLHIVEFLALYQH